jgi:hypothetical protein
MLSYRQLYPNSSFAFQLLQNNRVLCYTFLCQTTICNFLKVAIEDYHQAVAASFMKWIPISASAAAGVNLPAESKVVSAAAAAPGKHRKSSKVRLQAA